MRVQENGKYTHAKGDFCHFEEDAPVNQRYKIWLQKAIWSFNNISTNMAVVQERIWSELQNKMGGRKRNDNVQGKIM